MAFTNTMMLQGAQCKIEAVRGTAETAMTRWLYPTQGSLIWTYTQDHDDLVEANRSFHGHSAFSLGRYQNSFTYEERVSFEDIVWWMNMIMDGANLTGTTTGSTPPGYTYTMTPQSAVDDLSTFTMKAGEPGNIYKFDRCVVNKATFKWDANPGTSQPSWLMTLEIFARTVTPGSSYDALSERSRTIARSLGTVVSIDTTTIGTTPKTGYVRSGEFTIDNQIELKAFSEDTATMAADFARGEQLFTGSLVMEFKDDTEFALMRAGTQRKIRIKNTGALIGSTPTTNYQMQFDIGAAQWMAPSMGFSGQNMIQTFGWMGYKTAALAVPFTTAIVNTLASVTA